MWCWKTLAIVAGRESVNLPCGQHDESTSGRNFHGASELGILLPITHLLQAGLGDIDRIKTHHCKL